MARFVSSARKNPAGVHGARLPEIEKDTETSAVPALIIRREGDAPPFWGRDNSFIEAMSEIYMRVQRKNKGQL